MAHFYASTWEVEEQGPPTAAYESGGGAGEGRGRGGAGEGQGWGRGRPKTVMVRDRGLQEKQQCTNPCSGRLEMPHVELCDWRFHTWKSVTGDWRAPPTEKVVLGTK